MTTGSGSVLQPEFEGMPQRLYPASPSKLLAWLDCPRRYRMQYLDRPRPQARPQRAHTSVGVAVHGALRDWWDLPAGRRTPAAGVELVRTSWIDAGFRDPDQSRRWRERAQEAVGAYLSGVDPLRQPQGIERTVSFKTGVLAVQGRVDRLDDRDGQLVVVDYKTNRVPPTHDEARTSLPLALYAAAVWKMFRRRCVTVELHHVPSGLVAAHEHTPQSLKRKIDEAESIARDAQQADSDFARLGSDSSLFPARVGPLCQWCDYRAHCPAGQAQGPEKSSWAGLDDEAADMGSPETGHVDEARLR
ncbi:MAG TPA: PD-(D/E)XK nuclease family protein [Dermatophilaceae bacterium]|nr:PD-(D/E)XK nuclease family protein [Dermatophilaceae bacterium]